MVSQLAWLDHDAGARDRMHRILALFRDKEARDELGLGTVRDSIADQLFPGTSTIQTRLRYMLFVPWVYQRLEAERVPSSEIAQRARKLETQLMVPLLAEDDQAGVFGKFARGAIKRLPSSVYWAGLRMWGIRVFDGSLDDYHRAFDAIARVRRTKAERDTHEVSSLVVTWHPSLPRPPADFPEHASLALRGDEARWLQERILEAHGPTVLGFLTGTGVPDGLAAPWDLEEERELSSENRVLLGHARRFSKAMYGAALLYNHALAILPDPEGKPRRPDLADKLASDLEAWCADLGAPELRSWVLHDFWAAVRMRGHAVTQGTRVFIERWVEIARTGTMDRVMSREARELVETRERRLKLLKSRFTNERAYAEWGGTASLTPLTYRWLTVTSLLKDLHAGLGAA